MRTYTKIIIFSSKGSYFITISSNILFKFLNKTTIVCLLRYPTQETDRIDYCSVNVAYYHDKATAVM